MPKKGVHFYDVSILWTIRIADAVGDESAYESQCRILVV